MKEKQQFLTVVRRGDPIWAHGFDLPNMGEEGRK